MYNWSVDIGYLKKFPEKYKIWRLEQLINYGLRDEKINKQELRKYFNVIRIDPRKRKYLSFLLKNEK